MALASATVMVPVPCGRLSLVTATPIMISNQSAKATIFYVPGLGNRMPVRRGTRWSVEPISELSIALDSDSGHTGYHQSGKNFDILYDAVNARLCTSPAWTDDITRADALVRNSGLWTNNASIVTRFDASVSTATIGASLLTYLGTFRASANGQTQHKIGGTAAGGDKGSFLLWNAYNRVPYTSIVKDSTSNWVDNGGAAYHAFNAAVGSGLGNRVEFVRGLAEDVVDATLPCNMASGAGGASAPAVTGIGLDWTSGAPGGFTSYWESVIIGTFTSKNVAVPAIGFHYMQAVNLGVAAAGPTYYGNGNSSLYVALTH